MKNTKDFAEWIKRGGDLSRLRKETIESMAEYAEKNGDKMLADMIAKERAKYEIPL